MLPVIILVLRSASYVLDMVQRLIHTHAAALQHDVIMDAGRCSEMHLCLTATPSVVGPSGGNLRWAAVVIVDTSINNDMDDRRPMDNCKAFFKSTSCSRVNKEAGKSTLPPLSACEVQSSQQSDGSTQCAGADAGACV